jgi:hypothetical protein
MRPYFLLALVVLGLSACSDDDPIGGPGVHPDIRGSFVGPYQETGVSAGGSSDFQCDMRIDVVEQFEDAFIADVFFLESRDCAEEVLWVTSSGTIDLDGQVVLDWDFSDLCSVFAGDTDFVGALVGDVLSLTAAFECDGWSFADTYTGDRS